jgi:hypothetical protein
MSNRSISFFYRTTQIIKTIFLIIIKQIDQILLINQSLRYSIQFCINRRPSYYGL